MLNEYIPEVITWNNTQFNNPTITANSGLGQISSTSVSTRIIQVALKYLF
jgi:hypothetical protein